MNKEKILIFFLDAVRPDYITKKNTPFMYFLKQKETYLPVKTLLGYSLGIYPSIWTSTWQEQHGKFVVYVYDPEKSKFKWFKVFRYLPNKIRHYLFASLKIPYYHLPWFRRFLPKWYKEYLLDLWI